MSAKDQNKNNDYVHMFIIREKKQKFQFGLIGKLFPYCKLEFSLMIEIFKIVNITHTQ